MPLIAQVTLKILLIPFQSRIFEIKKMTKFQGREVPAQEISNMEKIPIPKGHFYVVGDNRNNTMDSRFYGTIPVETIDKLVHYVWWSDDVDQIGKTLDN